MSKCLTAIFLLLAFQFTSLQAQTSPVFSGKPVNFAESADLNSILSAYRVYEINASDLKSHLQSTSEPAKQFTLELPGLGVWSVTLTLRPLLSDAYRLRVHDGQQILELPGPGDITWVGHLTSDAAREVSLTVDDHFIFGTIQTPEGDFFIEPLGNMLSGVQSDRFIVYKTTDVLPNSDRTCGVREVSEKKSEYNPTVVERQIGLCKHVELAIASDYGMFTRYTNAAGVEAHNIGVMNEVASDYDDPFDDDIYFLIVTQYVSSTSTSSLDVALTATTNANTLLSNFRTWGNNSANFGIAFDLGQLWVTRNICDIDCSTIGLAYTVNAACGNNRYHLLEDFTNGNPIGWQLRVLTSHEIGHNFSCSHDAGSTTIMAANLNNTTTWSSQSISQVNTLLPAISCLFTCGVNFSAASFATSEYVSNTYLPPGTPSCEMGYTEILIPVQYSSSSTSGGSVTVSVTGGTATQNLDFSVPITTINFPVGSYSQTVNLILRIWNDAISEGSETIDLELIGGLVGSQNTATITILDDDFDPATNFRTFGQIGSGNSSNINVPFRGTFHDCRVQIVLGASEISAIGFAANDVINGLALDVFSKASSQPFNGFTIKMKHTASLPGSGGAFESGGFTTVYNANYSTTTGWNKFDFTQGFIWNGTSNVRIEFCYDNSSSTSNDLVRSSTGAVTIYDRANSSSGCSLPNSNFTYSSRPDIRLYKGSDIAITLGDDADTNLKTGQTAYFKDAQNEFILAVQHTSGPDPVCVNVEIDRAGIGKQSPAWLPGYSISDKTFFLTTDNPASTYDLTLFYHENEVSTAWGAAVSTLNIITSSSPISTANASNSSINESVVYSEFGPVSNNDLYRSYKATFTGLSGGFALTDAPETALPVEWLDFTGKLVGENVLLRWTTATEQDNKGFDVERSDDGSFFEKIGFVEGQGAIFQAKPYYFEDAKALRTNVQILYYRLKQIDTDGNFSYSKIVPVHLPREGSVWQILPNPTRGEVILQRNACPECVAILLLTDAAGREALRQQVSGSRYAIDLSDLPTGVYLLTMRTDEGSLWQTKLVRM